MPKFIAVYNDNTSYEGDLLDGSFKEIDHDKLSNFTIIYNGVTASLDLCSGIFTIQDIQQLRPIPPNPRLIAYVSIRGNLDSLHTDSIYAFVVGWQATIPIEGAWRNIKLGLRVIPSESRWEITEAI